MCNSNKNNILIICRDLQSVRRLSSFNPQAHSRYILASDDPRVHEAVKEYPWIDEICWIEKMESFYNVADDMIHLTEAVNQWLKSLADDKHGFSAELLFFTRHVEGGMTTQRIQDLLLLIRSYHFLLNTYKITSVIVISQPGMGWEDDVLIETTRSRDINVQLIGHYSFGVLIKKVGSFLKIYARVAYYLFSIIRFNLRNRFKSKKTERIDKEIIFQLCSSAYKHVENIIPLMKTLRHRGYNPVALCWHSNARYTKEPGVDQVRREGLQAEELEKWCSFSDMWRSIIAVFWTWKKAKRKKSEFLTHKDLYYLSVPLGVLLWPSVRFFIIVELPQSYRLRQALKKYFKKHDPLAIKPWGGLALKEGYFAWKSLNIKQRPLIFHYAVGVFMIDWPYQMLDNPVDLLFVPGEINKRVVEKTKFVPSGKIEICGQAKYEGIDDFKKKYNCTQSRSYLRMPSNFSMYILFDSGMVLRGFMSSREQAVTLNALLKFASTHPSVALIVKPHPSHHEGIVEDMIRYSKDSKNVFLINKNMLPYHALNSADVLITKFSTLGIEAMLFNCPVIFCILNNKQHFKIYEGAADYIDRIENLEDLLIKLVNDDNFRCKWHNEHIQKQKDFLARYFCEIEESPSVYQAKILDRYLATSR